MRKSLTILYFIFFTLILQAQVSKTINITAGTLSSALTATEKTTITDLTITGTIDARDFKTMRDSMDELLDLDLSEVSIVAYSGTLGTVIGTTIIDYEANAIPQFAFFNTNNYPNSTMLNSIILPFSAITVKRNAFYSCKNLKDITFNSNLTSIGQSAFSNCESILSIDLDSSINLIGIRAFENCTGIKTLNFSNSLNSISEYAFNNCSNIESLNIPSSVSRIGYNAFSNCASLTGTLILPSSLLEIEYSIFSGCSGLESLILPPNITEIGPGAFNGCTGLDGMLNIPSSVNFIGSDAFIYCRGLDSLIIPSSVLVCESNAFFNCESLRSIYVKLATPIDLDLPNSYTVFGAIDKSLCTLFVPFGSRALYESAHQWQDFENIVEVSGFGVLSKTAFVEAESGSTDSIVINSNVEWFTSSDQTWLTVTPTTNNGSDTLIFTSEANPDLTKRTASATVSAPGFESETISITQREAVFETEVNAGELYTVLNNIELNSLTRLKLKGSIDARDFKTMRDSMPALEDIDISEVSIVAYSGLEGTVYSDVIVDYDENTVPQNAFYGSSRNESKESLQSIILPNNTFSIATKAFYRCVGLTSINIPSTVTSIGIETFSNCYGLKNITIPPSLSSLGTSAFSYCFNLSGTITLPSSLTCLEKNTFYRCESLKSVIIPLSVNKIGKEAFSGCSKLITINLPNSITKIEDKVFSDCNALTTVILPSNVDSIGQGAFYRCKSLASITFPASIRDIGSFAFFDCIGLTGALNIPSSISSIKGYSFSGCSGLTSINIPSSVSSIGGFAFRDCGFIGTIIIPSSIKNIEPYTFSGCGSLNKVILPATISSIGKFAFNGCGLSGSLILPSSVTNIGSQAYANCSSLDSIVIPLSVSTIGRSAFYFCRNLKSIYVKSGTPIDLTDNSNVFLLINKFTCKLYVPFGSKSFYETANQWKDFKNIVELPGFGIAAATVYVEAEDNSQESVMIKSNVNWSAYSDQSWLKVNPTSNNEDSVLVFTAEANPNIIPRTAIVTVSASGFESENIIVTQREAVLNVNVTAGGLSVALNAFDINTITRLKVNGTIDARDFKTMRDSMPELLDLNLRDAEIVAYQGVLGPLFGVDEAYPADAIPQFSFDNWRAHPYEFKLLSIELPVNLTAINENAFHSCSSIREIILYPSLKTIGKNAFGDCHGLDSINLPSGILSIGEGAFSYCDSIKTINLPIALTSIEDYTFSGCRNLKSILIPSLVSSIKYHAFANCTSLKSVELPFTLKTIGSGAFSGCSKLENIILPTGIDSIGRYAFSDCFSLKAINLPKSLGSIEESTFSECYSLSELIISDSIENIGRSAFSSCVGLTNLKISNSVKNIDEYAFAYCSNLDSIYSELLIPVDLSTTTEVFYRVDKNTCTLYVPFGTKTLYESAKQWQDFLYIVEMPITVPDGLSVSDTIVSNTEYSCFNAHNIITVAGDGSSVDFESGSTVNLIAEQSIQFLPGFHTHEGSSMLAYITTTGEFCDAITPSTIVYMPEVKSNEIDFLPEPALDFNKPRSVKVYPNPNNGQFIIQLCNFKSRVDVCIYNTLGAIVYKSSGNSLKQVEVNLPEIKRGLYFIKIQEGNQQFTEKIIVQ